MTIFRTGGIFAEYLRATEKLRRDPFYDAFFGEQATEEGYRANQKRFMAENHPFDETSELVIYVPSFRETLAKIRCPVLALFGEKDSTVDWRSTKALYEETLGRRDAAPLDIRRSRAAITTCRSAGPAACGKRGRHHRSRRATATSTRSRRG